MRIPIDVAPISEQNPRFGEPLENFGTDAIGNWTSATVLATVAFVRSHYAKNAARTLWRGPWFDFHRSPIMATAKRFRSAEANGSSSVSLNQSSIETTATSRVAPQSAL